MTKPVKNIQIATSYIRNVAMPARFIQFENTPQSDVFPLTGFDRAIGGAAHYIIHTTNNDAEKEMNELLSRMHPYPFDVRARCEHYREEHEDCDVLAQEVMLSVVQFDETDTVVGYAEACIYWCYDEEDSIDENITVRDVAAGKWDHADATTV